jgi:hypothetical protein
MSFRSGRLKWKYGTGFSKPNINQMFSISNGSKKRRKTPRDLIVCPFT